MVVLFTFLLLQFGHAADANPYPDSCQVKSPEMKLVQTCERLSDNAKGLSAGRFISTLDSNGSGVNFCYNSYVSLQEEPGKPATLRVFRDNDKGQLRATTYTIPYAKTQRIASSLLVSLDGQEGQCFAYEAENKGLCHGFLGFGSENIPMVLKLNDSVSEGLSLEATKNRDDISQAKVNRLAPSNDFTKDDVQKVLVRDLQSKLELYSSRTDKDSTLKSAWNDCFNAFNQYTSSHNLQVTWSKSFRGENQTERTPSAPAKNSSRSTH